MEPVATSGVLAMDLDSPAAEIQDFDSVVRLYWPRIFRFVLASAAGSRCRADPDPGLLSQSLSGPRPVSRRGQRSHLADSDRRQSDSGLWPKSPASVLEARA